MHPESLPGPEPQDQIFGALISKPAVHRLAKLGRLAGAGLLIAGNTLGLTTIGEVLDPATAHADITYSDLGYPWANATYVDANYDWGFSACPKDDPGCMSPFFGYLKGVRYGETDPWNYYLRNCTSYVAWEEATKGVTVGALGNGGDWYANAPASEQSLIPKAWDAAVVPPTKSNPYGHLAFLNSVDSVDPHDPDNDVITVFEYNYDGKGDGDARTGVASAMGFTRFVDFGVHPHVDTAPAALPDNLFVLQGNTLFAKSNLLDTWTTLTNAANGFQAAGQRVAIIDTNGNLEAKDGLYAPWEFETSAVDQYVITPNLLAIRVGQVVYAKAELSAPWTTVATNAASLEAAGGRLAWQDTSGMIWARDGVLGASFAETQGAAQYVVTPNLLLVRQGTMLFGKTQLGDNWLRLTNAATDVGATATRIVITDTNGAVEAKDGLGGAWKLEITNADEFVVTPESLLVRQGAILLGKVALADSWSVVAAGISSFRASGPRIAVVSSNGAIMAKDGLDGTWVNVTSGAAQYQIANTE